MVLEYTDTRGHLIKYVCPKDPINSVAGKTYDVTISGVTYTVYNSCIYGKYSLLGVMLFDSPTTIEKYQYYNDNWNLESTYTVNYNEGTVYTYSETFYSTVGGLHIENVHKLFEDINISKPYTFTGIEYVTFEDSFEYCTEPVLTYTWSPVNKINGKMGNVNLSQIIYLNDGDPVTGADSEDVTFVDESGLDVLIEKATWVDDAVTVEYYIPNDTFEYVKLVYKYGDVPADINDGTAIDLDPNKTSLVITDIENPDNYWFIIFTDKSCSLGYELITNQDTALYNLLSGMF